jgi:hypothetical protein
MRTASFLFFIKLTPDAATSQLVEHDIDRNVDVTRNETGSYQKPPSRTRVVAGAFGFLTLIQVLDGPDR